MSRITGQGTGGRQYGGNRAPIETTRSQAYAQPVTKRANVATGAALLLAGIALGVVGYHFLTANDKAPWWQAVPNIAIAWTFLGAGLIAWWRRPASWVGPLLLLAGFALLLRKLEYSDDSVLFTLGFALSGLYAAVFAHVVLAYPSGHVRDRLERWFLYLVYGLALLLPLAVLLAFDSQRSCLFACSHADRPRPESLIGVIGDDTVYGVVHRTQQIGGYGVAGSLFIVLILRRLYRSSRPARRRLALLMLAGLAAGFRAITDTVYSFVPRSNVEGLALFSIQEAVQIALPIVLLVALLNERLARANVADLVRKLAETPPSEVATPVGRALGDPSLEVAFWMPARRGYVDAEGRVYELPAAGSGRAVTPLAHDGEPVAVLVHDPALLEDARLLESVCAAALMSLENARLHADLQAQLLKVRESRTRIVAAADDRARAHRARPPRRRPAAAGGARARAPHAPSGGSAADGHGDEDAAPGCGRRASRPPSSELRDARAGRLSGAPHARRGLRRHSTTLAAAHAGAPSTSSTLPPDRLAPDVEATAYFVACEALANAVKHSRATQIEVGAIVAG